MKAPPPTPAVVGPEPKAEAPRPAEAEASRLAERPATPPRAPTRAQRKLFQQAFIESARKEFTAPTAIRLSANQWVAKVEAVAPILERLNATADRMYKAYGWNLELQEIWNLMKSLENPTQMVRSTLLHLRRAVVKLILRMDREEELRSSAWQEWNLISALSLAGGER